MGDINLEERRGSLGGVKRQRTDKYPVQEEHSRFRSHSRSSSSNDVHSGSERSNTSTPPSPFQPEHSIQPLPASLLTSVISGGELETKVNRLTEIVDQWYRHAYARGGQGPQGQTPTVKPTPELAPEIWAAMAGLQAETNQESHHNASNDNDNMQRQKPQPEMPPEQKYRPQSKERDTVPSFCAQPESRPATAVSSTHFASGAGDVDEVALGHLSIQENGRSRYVGSSFWALLSSESTELNQFLKSSNKTSSQNHDISGLSTPPQDEGSYASPISSQSPVPSRSGISSGENLVSLLQLLPSKSLCHKLYASFLTGVHPVMPLIHAPTFDRQYQSFWEWFPDNTHTLPGSDIVDNPTFLPLLFAVLYSGTMSMAPKTVKENFEGRSKEQITAHLHAAATDALTAAQFPRAPTLNSLITFLIIQTCMIREEEPLTSFSFIGTAMRVAQQMGLHRDGSLFGLGEIECEVRRRVWWHIMHLDIQGAIATGLPPLGGSGEDQFDTRMVSELRDECIGSAVFPDTPVCSARGSPAAEGAPYCEYPKTKTSPAMILAVGRYETAILIRKIITRLLGIKPPHKTDIVELGEKIYNLKTNIERKIARIPARGLPEMGFIPGGENVEEEREGVFNSWARIMLSMLSDRAYGVLYQPFLKSAKNKLWMHARHW
ncbi:fungal-specific transcription factor domain-containing protein [Geopyxis carbonaria]|nr:fungal-specific transcription factor domain-containing protein [Geopyxis carbonaria]